MADFKVGDRVRYVGGYTPFYVSPKPNALGTVTAAAEDAWSARIEVTWDDRLRYCKETDRRNWRMHKADLEPQP
ncbi:hypothetical protein [Xylophilus sp.]|uniref:hypothetical protein n=1 Tax=Xylophilus sp. TaxID=2653893 RepID=UPI0013B8BAD8|nr:hypothetical protein [Xylophilus sp.]KAF1045656.1 MAG: hypothetical protein GAK38_02948 [Xylophilus sp.]